MVPHTAHKVNPFRRLQHDNFANQPENKHILLVLVNIFNSHMILHLLLRFSIERDTKMCVTDYCPHSYSYRMILHRISFSYPLLLMSPWALSSAIPFLLSTKLLIFSPNLFLLILLSIFNTNWLVGESLVFLGFRFLFSSFSDSSRMSMRLLFHV